MKEWVAMKKYPQINKEERQDSPRVIMETNKGKIKIVLFPEHAPKTVENFLGLIEKGYYDDVVFHRVIKDFMIQGGDPTASGMGGESLWGEPFEDEFSDELFNLYGALSMANAGPNTNGSQFFIVSCPEVNEDMLSQMALAGYEEPIIDAYQELGGTPWLDQRHTVFGQVEEGMDVVLEIQESKTNAFDRPEEDVVIERIQLLS